MSAPITRLRDLLDRTRQDRALQNRSEMSVWVLEVIGMARTLLGEVEKDHERQMQRAEEAEAAWSEEKRANIALAAQVTLLREALDQIQHLSPHVEITLLAGDALAATASPDLERRP